MRPSAVLRAMRPKQWIKNLLVLAAPFAAGAIGDAGLMAQAALAAAAFVLASAAVYLVNDIRDLEADRAHPTKRHRPLAAGEVAVGVAAIVAGVLAVSALGLAFWLTWQFSVLIVSYLAIQYAYASWLKHEPVLDIACVASGFLLRALAGGLATGLPISTWFLLVAAFGSLFVVAGKRYSELRVVGVGVATRAALLRYSESYLRFVWTLAASVAVVAYSLWAFTMTEHNEGPWHELSVAPFVLGLMRYAVDVDAAKAGDPEDIIWADRVLQVIGVVWLVLVGLGVYVG